MPCAQCETLRCVIQVALAESKNSADTLRARFVEEHALAVADLSRYEEVCALQSIVAASSDMLMPT